MIRMITKITGPVKDQILDLIITDLVTNFVTIIITKRIITIRRITITVAIR